MGSLLRFTLLPLALSLKALVLAADSPDDFMEAGFSFDWTTAGTPVPVVEQCDFLPISWSRGTAQGPNPTAPYVLQIYTSTFITPLIVDAGSDQSFNWSVPFVPDTQFQICMFDKDGVTGGCQRIMTVIPSAADSTPTCRNLTYPAPSQALAVTALDVTGPMSQYGWPAQCTDLSLTPTSGTPPYTLTVAPSLHPPYNITSNTTGAPINWTIALSWASPFFISLADSDGNAWSYGPLHSGRGQTNECLNPVQKTSKDNNKSVSVAVVAGSSVAAAIGGLLLGLLAAFCLFGRSKDGPRILRRYSRDSLLANDTMTTAGNSYGSSPSMGVNSLGQNNTNAYRVEPWVPPAGASHQSPAETASSPPATADSSEGRQAGNGSHVYVVHHDGGRAPVTVYTQEGTEVVELPPRYANDGSVSSGQGSAGRQRASQFKQRRLPNTPRKDEVRLEPPPSATGTLTPQRPSPTPDPTTTTTV